MRYPLIALTGYARTGKDEVGKILVRAGYNRVAFGDIIKSQLNSLIELHFGFSAFTEVTSEKQKIRRTLESWGEDNYERVFKEFFDNLATPSVNTRLCRVREAREWVNRGGILVEVRRPGVGPETPTAEAWVRELREAGLIRHIIFNGASLEALEANVEATFL